MDGIELVIVRHGDPDYATDSLTQTGRIEAAALAESLQRFKPTELYTSPMGRARETASFSEEKLGVSAKVLNWTAELEALVGLRGFDGFGAAWDLPGSWVRPAGSDLSLWDQLPAEAQAAVNQEVERIGNASDSFLAGFGLVKTSQGYLISEPFPPRRIMVFCHGGFGLTWLSYLLSIPVQLMWANFYLAPTSVSRVLFERRAPGLAVPRAVQVGDTGHLAELSLPENRRGLYGLDNS